jgi:hypothetical protein
MCDECRLRQRSRPPLSLVLWFIVLTAFLVALARWA